MKHVLTLFLLLSLSGKAQDTILHQRGKDLYMTVNHRTGLVVKQELYEKYYDYDRDKRIQERRKRRMIMAFDITLLALFFGIIAVRNK